MSKKIKIGDKFEKLEIISSHEKIGRYLQWKCKCSCGNIIIIQNKDLKNKIDCGMCSKVKNKKTTYMCLETKKMIISK